MDPWVLSDGTKVYLGGRVDGDSYCARLLRGKFASHEPQSSEFGPYPSPFTLDAKTPHLVDAFVRCWARPLTVVSAPQFDTPTPIPSTLPPGTVY